MEARKSKTTYLERDCRHSANAALSLAIIPSKQAQWLVGMQSNRLDEFHMVAGESRVQQKLNMERCGAKSRRSWERCTSRNRQRARTCRAHSKQKNHLIRNSKVTRIPDKMHSTEGCLHKIQTITVSGFKYKQHRNSAFELTREIQFHVMERLRNFGAKETTVK